MDIKDKATALFVWMLIFVSAIIFLWLAFTGRLGILMSIAFLPDNVAVMS